MFNSFRRWFNNRQREIFKFWDGAQWRYVDPLVVRRAILTHPKLDAETHGPAYDRGDPEAVAVIIEAARDAFELSKFSSPMHSGLTERETLKLFQDFLAYLEELKKNSSLPPITALRSPAAILQWPPNTPIGSSSSEPPSTPTDVSIAMPGCC